jgi:hypothetical protein
MGTATDAIGVASVKVNGVLATYSAGTWSLVGIALMSGANVLNVVATDMFGNAASISVTRKEGISWSASQAQPMSLEVKTLAGKTLGA